MKEEPLAYSAGHVKAKGMLVLPPANAKRPGVLVIHDGFGLGEQTKRRARMVAELGFVALAADMYGGGVLVENLADAYALSKALRNQPDEMRRRACDALTTLAARPEVDASRIAAIGYCFGGTCVLEMVRATAPVCAAVVFHGALDTSRPAAPRARLTSVLVCTGAEDPLVPASQIAAFQEEMKSANLDWQIHLYGGVKHNFTNPDSEKLNRPAVAYDATADHRSWIAMRRLLAEAFNEPEARSP